MNAICADHLGFYVAYSTLTICTTTKLSFTHFLEVDLGRNNFDPLLFLLSRLLLLFIPCSNPTPTTIFSTGVMPDWILKGRKPPVDGRLYSEIIERKYLRSGARRPRLYVSLFHDLVDIWLETCNKHYSISQLNTFYHTFQIIVYLAPISLYQWLYFKNHEIQIARAATPPVTLFRRLHYSPSLAR